MVQAPHHWERFIPSTIICYTFSTPVCAVFFFTLMLLLLFFFHSLSLFLSFDLNSTFRMGKKNLLRFPWHGDIGCFAAVARASQWKTIKYFVNIFTMLFANRRLRAIFFNLPRHLSTHSDRIISFIYLNHHGCNGWRELGLAWLCYTIPCHATEWKRFNMPCESLNWNKNKMYQRCIDLTISTETQTKQKFYFTRNGVDGGAFVVEELSK